MEEVAHANRKHRISDHPRKARAKLPEGESRQDKFVRLAERRMTKVRIAVRQVLMLGKYYPHNDEQRERVIGEMRRLALEVQAAFEPKPLRSDEFKF